MSNDMQHSAIMSSLLGQNTISTYTGEVIEVSEDDVYGRIAQVMVLPSSRMVPCAVAFPGAYNAQGDSYPIEVGQRGLVFVTGKSWRDAMPIFLPCIFDGSVENAETRNIRSIVYDGGVVIANDPGAQTSAPLVEGAFTKDFFDLVVAVNVLRDLVGSLVTAGAGVPLIQSAYVGVSAQLIAMQPLLTKLGPISDRANTNVDYITGEAQPSPYVAKSLKVQ